MQLWSSFTVWLFILILFWLWGHRHFIHILDSKIITPVLFLSLYYFRALEIIYDKGQKVSDILAEQQSARDASTSGGGLRFTNAIVLWLQCVQDVLDDRLNKRVDSMMEQGLVNELLEFHHKYNQERLNTNVDPDYTKGIYQAIGFKEFHNYLMLSNKEQCSSEGKSESSKAVEQLKLVTRRFARKQKRWQSEEFRL
ncbi:unnamed protein product [Acanthoscelides obtectus]|uniref:Uncharacterized protein n=1 Tax=Acanthoscelides obtectus TaxID=200917 RepID=A0A9P0QIE3_ACAOB|nr:unnamed protein product [Acanthoscelides obtectus]CAK1684541.1 tRNA dimethylallyltransferase [Acanthoscelides obtectus]